MGQIQRGKCSCDVGIPLRFRSLFTFDLQMMPDAADKCDATGTLSPLVFAKISSNYFAQFIKGYMCVATDFCPLVDSVNQ